MPRAVRLPLPPRRPSAEDCGRTYRREVLGLPGPIDLWLSANKADEIGKSDCPLSPDEVRCYIQIHHKQGECDGDFADPDAYTLYLTIATLHKTGVPGTYLVFPKVVLDSYSGWNSSLDAPGWTQWSPSRTVVFRQSKDEIIELFLTVAPRKDNIDVLAKGIESIRV